MPNVIKLKLIAVIDSIRMILYEAKGLKIINKSYELSLTLEEHYHHREKKQSHYSNKSNPGSLFDPHTPTKVIEHNEAAKNAAKQLAKVIKQAQRKYKELIIIAEPQMLGRIRRELDNNLKKLITKEIAKDLTQHSQFVIEHTIFT